MWNKHRSEKMLVFFFALVTVFSLSSLSVNAVFANCPGDTTNGWWDISDTQTVNTTETIVCEYINITSTGKLYVNSSVGNFTVNITVGNLTIQVGGEINGTGTGFENATGEGAAVSGLGPGGAGHGGRGGAGSGGFNGGNQYGFPLEPRTLGSGGGGAQGGDGGGAVLINVSNITWVNGTIAINGEPVKTGIQGGGGAGGSLYLDTDSLFGIGTIEAKGGQGRDTANDGGSGGGGRIAVYYKITGEGFSFNNTNVESLDSPGTGATGDQGTAVFIDKDDKNLYIVGGFDFTLPTYNYSNVTVEHAWLRANNSFEFNATNFVNTGGRVTNMTCYNTSHDFTIRTLRVLGLDNVNITDSGRSYSECGNITIHRLETRTNYTVNTLTVLSNKTLIFNVTSDDLVLQSTSLIGNLNITNLTNLSIDSLSSLNATGRGNPNGTFEGKAKDGVSGISAGGGGYGGIGGTSEDNSVGGPQYGDPFAPSLFGSPGGAGNNGVRRGTAGGGIIYLNISGTLWNNGTISADGEDKKETTADGGGAGSGGSVWIDTANYYGTGTLSAGGGQTPNAGGAGGTGSGGRIAVYYNATNSEVFFNRTNVQSPISVDPSTGAGDPGTALFVDKDDKNLYIVGGFDFTLPTYNYSNVTVEHAFLRINTSFELNATNFVNTGGRVTNMTCYNTSHDFTIRTLRVLGLDNVNVSDKGANYNECGNITIHRLETRTNMTINNLYLLSNKTLIFNVTSDDLVLQSTSLIGNLNITNLTNLSIDSLSSLNATARGNPNGTFEGKARDGGAGIAAGGGGYGGIGGTSEDNLAGGPPYGDPFAPGLFGAPGGAGNNGVRRGTNGGGIIYLNISGTLWNNGTISADGEDRKEPINDGGGGGSGGSIWIDTTNYYGVGKLQARGATTIIGAQAAGTGAGGRIAVYYNNTNSEVSFNTTDVQSQDSADTGTGAGDPGTAIFMDKDDKNLYIVGGFEFTLPTYNFSNVTIEHAFLRINNTFELNATTFVNTGGRVTNMTCYNTSHDFTFRILQVVGMDNFNLSDMGKNFNECGNISIHRTETRTNYSISFATIESNGTLIFNVTDDDLTLTKTIFFGNMNFTVVNMTINGTSSLIANFRGYGNGTGPGTGTTGSSGGGAGYGGAGGAGQGGEAGGSTYGSNLTPNDLGSGGAGSRTEEGGNGGGAIFINASNRLEINGTINASGRQGFVGQTGGGSGGSIWLWTRIVNGTGNLSAHGGNGAAGVVDGGGGGGGRIAVYFRNDQTTGFSRDVNGGEGTVAVDGSAGTVEFLQTNDTVAPTVINLQPPSDRTAPARAIINLTVNVTDNDEVQVVLINITYPDNTSTGQLSSLLNLTKTGTLYNFSFGDTTMLGTYNITYIANDTSGNINDTTKTNFTILVNAAPTQGTPILNTTLGQNTTLENLTVYNISTADVDNESVKNIITWYRNNTLLTILNVPMEGGSNISDTKDYGVTATNGAVDGAFRNATGGYDGKGAYNFDGKNDVISWDNETFFDITTELSVELWFRRQGYGLTVTPQLEVMIAKGQATPGGFFVGFNSSESKLIAGVNNLKMPGNSVIQNNTWYHVVVSYNTTNVSLYVDGVLDASKGHSGLVLNNVNITIGGFAVAGRPFNGTIDDVRIWNVSLTAGQAEALYRNLTNTLVSDQLKAGETWNASITPNDGGMDGTTKVSTAVTISQDTTAPSVTNVRPVANNFTKQSVVANISATVTDGIAVDSVRANVTYPDNTTKEQLVLVKIGNIYNYSFGNTSTQGHYNVTFIANDSVGNINSTEKTNFTVDSTAPSVRLLVPVAGTSFTNGTVINVSTTVTDEFLNVDVVLGNITWPDNTTKEQLRLEKVGSIYNYSYPNATAQAGVYNLTFIANDTNGNINATEKTNFTINATIVSAGIDIANTTNITFTPDPIRQNDRVSFNATFNVTGNLNATGLNVTLTVDNAFIASTSFNLENGTTRQVELNWTAENGTHAIRINADANNTFNTETFENNNNATATITVFNVSVLNFTSPSQNAEIIRGKDTNSLPGEDTLKKVSNFTTIQARVYNKYATGVGVNSNCTYYFNNTIFLGWNQTNTTGECTFTYDHTIYATDVYNVTVNYTNLNTTNYLADSNNSLIDNESLIDLSKVEIDLDAENQRTGSVYNPGDVAVMNITVTKNSTAFDPNKFIIEVKDPGTECNTAGGIFFNHTYPGDVVRLSTGLFQSYSVLEVDTDIHWCLVVNNSAGAPLASASHSDKEVTNTNANRANFTILNSESQGDDAVFDDVNITFFSSRGNYKIFDRNFSTTDGGENRVLTLNEGYDVLFRHPGRQEQLNITGLNITAGNKSLPFNLLINYSGVLPVRFTNLTDIIAFNNSGFTFTSANITLQKSNLSVNKIVHCTNWNFSAGACIGTWEINQTSAYANFGENATHMWFQVSGFTAYAGGNGSNVNLTIYDQTDVEGGSVAAQTGNNINFTANYTRAVDNVTITGASCNISFSTAPLEPSAMTFDNTKQIYNFTRTFNTTGNFTWNATCGAASFDTLTAVDTIEVSDTTAPTVSAISPTSITSAQQYTFSATVTDGSSPLTCNLFINNANDGAMTVSGTTASRVASFNVSSQQKILFYANCTDPSGNNGFNITNVSVAPQELGGGNPGGGARAGGESSAATAEGLGGGTTYLNLGKGDIVAITGDNVESQVRILAVYPNSVRLDVGGYNVILLEGLFRRYDLNNNGILETTIYVDDVVSYSKVAISILVEEDGGTTAQSSQFFDVLGAIWQRVVGEPESAVEITEKTGEVEEQEELSPAEEPQQVEQSKESYTKRVLNFMVEFGEYVKSKGGMTGSVVAAQGENLQGIISSPAQKAVLVSILTLGVLVPAITCSYVYRKKYIKRKNKLAEELEEEMKYKGL